MEQPDAVIHQPLRLKIMAALKGLPPGERLEFVRLRSVLNVTEGNLGGHLGTLEKAATSRSKRISTAGSRVRGSA